MKPTKLLAVALVLCGVWNFTSRAHGVTGKLLAGTAKVSITPVTDEPLHDPVYARSLVLEINRERLAFVSVDLGVFTSDNVETTCKEKYGIAKVFLCSSHNHTGPSKPGKAPVAGARARRTCGARSVRHQTGQFVALGNSDSDRDLGPKPAGVFRS
jgi:hypothetical protein